MIILQTAGGDIGSLGLKAGLLDGSSASATTFRNNAYIHRLNRTLQAEMRAISAYRSLQLRPGDSQDIEAATAHHQQAGKELVCLIIANRGIPEDRSALSLGLTKTFIHFCSRVPSRLTTRVTFSTLKQLERQLVSNYQSLIKEAPSRDLVALNELLAKAEAQAG